MTEQQTNELLTAMWEIEKQISEKQNEKRNLESQKSKLEFSIRNLQEEIETLREKLKKTRTEYYEKLLNEAKWKLKAVSSDENLIAQDDTYVYIKKYWAYYLYDKEDSELIEIWEDINVVRVYDLRFYDDLLDDRKSDAYNSDNFLRRQRVEEIENYYYNDSLADYLDWIYVSDIELDDLLEDEAGYIKWEDMEELDSFIESDAQYFNQTNVYSLRDENTNEKNQ